jgi:hypothetical protein
MGLSLSSRIDGRRLRGADRRLTISERHHAANGADRPMNLVTYKGNAAIGKSLDSHGDAIQHPEVICLIALRDELREKAENEAADACQRFIDEEDPDGFHGLVKTIEGALRRLDYHDMADFFHKAYDTGLEEIADPEDSE